MNDSEGLKSTLGPGPTRNKTNLLFRDVKTRIYADLAKLRRRIEDMEDGPRKARALHLWYLLMELFI